MDISVYVDEMTSRHLGILTREEQDILSQSTICGAGTGGVGGWTYLGLARLGCSRFRIADPDGFDASNVNRQAGSSINTLGRNKAEVIAYQITEINPKAEVEQYSCGLTTKNIVKFIEYGNIVIDGIDFYEPQIKKKLYDVAREHGLAIFSSPILGFGSAIAIFHPQKSPSFQQYFGPIPQKCNAKAYQHYLKMISAGYFGFKPRLDWPVFIKRIEEGKVPSIGASCMLAGAMSTMAIIDYLLGKNNFPFVPTTVHIDLMQHKLVKIGPLKRWFFRQFVNLYLRYLE